MSQVTRRGLVQAGLSCALLAAICTPRDIAPALTLPPLAADIDGVAKKRLVDHIARLFHQPVVLVSRIVEAAFRQAHLTDLPALLILAVVAKESGFRPSARSGYGAIGLMQVVPRWHDKLIANLDHPQGLEHPESNIAAGAVILSKLMKNKKGDLSAALQKYSGGARQYTGRVVTYWAQFADVGYRHA